MKCDTVYYVNCALGPNFEEYLLDEVVFARHVKYNDQKANLVYHEGKWHLDNSPFDFVLDSEMESEWEFLFIK